MSDPQPHATFQAPEPAALAPLFPGYEIETLIATGGMGAVYRAVQKSLDRTVAIKILPHEFSDDAAFCSGFEAEAKAMARLNHPNLIGVYDFGEVNGMLYIIMEYVPGKSLFHSSHGTAIDPAEVIRLVTGICDGLAHAHEHGILHRDIKPSNILLDLHAQPKIGDFGLARPVDSTIQEGEEIFGTPHYTAPEVVNAPHSVDCRADIFSVGVMLHELLTGRLPADDPRPASAICHCDPRFDAIVRRATHPSPEMRYRSASEISRDLHAIEASSGPRVLKTANPNTPSRVGQRPVKPLAHTTKSSGNSGLVLLFIAGIIGVIAWLLTSKKEPAPPPTPPANVSETTTAPAPEPEPKAAPEPVPKPSLPEDEPKSTEPTKDHLADHDTAADTDTATDAVTDSDDSSTTDTGTKHSTEPEEKTTTEQPKFDVAGFFERARTIMRDRAAPLIAERDKNLKENLTAYEKGAKRLVRRIDWRYTRDQADEALDLFIKDCEENNHRLPAMRPYGQLGNVNGLTKLHTEFHDKQEAIDALLMQSLFQLSSTYILGLQKQIERLQNEDDPVAIKLIEKEIEKTREDESYFPDLMLGDESDDE
jgi:serine/threonine protein kinase